MIKVGDMIRSRDCSISDGWTLCRIKCPFCKGSVPRTGLVLESWIDLDDEQSLIAIFGTEEIVIRNGASTPWMNIGSYEVLT